eukprot:6198541-Pleurochrysis_carterae.AAC.1
MPLRRSHEGTAGNCEFCCRAHCTLHGHIRGTSLSAKVACLSLCIVNTAPVATTCQCAVAMTSGGARKRGARRSARARRRAA